MELAHFITTLITQGKVSVQGKLSAFEQDDLAATKKLLQQYYSDDVLELPFSPLPFNEAAAIWAAEYFYKAVQLTVLRDATAENIKETLLPYDGPVLTDAIYSADLVLRYLPSLFNLAKGLAPGDVLVECFLLTATLWPFSSVGIELKEAVHDEVIQSSPALRQLYTDRIIEKKDKARIQNETIENYIYETTGSHLPVLWPGFEPLIK